MAFLEPVLLGWVFPEPLLVAEGLLSLRCDSWPTFSPEGWPVTCALLCAVVSCLSWRTQSPALCQLSMRPGCPTGDRTGPVTLHAVPAGWVASGLRVLVGTGPFQSLSCLFSVISLSSKSLSTAERLLPGEVHSCPGPLEKSN